MTAANALFTLNGKARPSYFEKLAVSQTDPSLVTVVAPTDPETEPAAIAADQRRDVAREWRRLWRVKDIAARMQLVSEAVLLDQWTVRRRLKELGHLGPDTDGAKAAKWAAKKALDGAVLAELERGGPGTYLDINARMGRPADGRSHVRRTLFALCARGRARVSGQVPAPKAYKGQLSIYAAKKGKS